MVRDLYRQLKAGFLRLPQQRQVFIGTSLFLLFSVVSFYGFPQKKSGHNLFDVHRYALKNE